MNNRRYILVITNEYEIEEVSEHLKKEDAEHRLVEQANNYLEQESGLPFTTVDEVNEYIFSEEWWDNDERTNLDITEL